MSTTDLTNPKDLLGVKKPPLDLIPPVASVHASMAHRDGAIKYGPWNWREKKVKASIYIAAAKRHIELWHTEKEETARDSGVHHLGHAIACLNIILDAQACGALLDDRPWISAGLNDLIETMSKGISEGKYRVPEAPAPEAPAPVGVQSTNTGRFEDYLPELIEEVLSPHAITSRMGTDALAKKIHEIWIEKSNQITGIEPIVGELNKVREEHPRYRPTSLVGVSANSWFGGPLKDQPKK
jgi:hypothetical protein